MASLIGARPWKIPSAATLLSPTSLSLSKLRYYSITWESHFQSLIFNFHKSVFDLFENEINHKLSIKHEFKS